MACHIHKKQKIILLLPEGQGITEAAGIHALVLTQGFMSMWVYIYMYATKFIGCLPMEIAGLNYTCSNWSSVWLWIGHASTLFDLFGVFYFFFLIPPSPSPLFHPSCGTCFLQPACVSLAGRVLWNGLKFLFPHLYHVLSSTGAVDVGNSFLCPCGDERRANVSVSSLG